MSVTDVSYSVGVEYCHFINNLFTLNGRFFKIKIKVFLHLKKKFVIDYIIATPECFEFISDFSIIETDPLFSDGHSAHYLKLLIPNIKNNYETDPTPSCPLYWNSNYVQNFVSKINFERVNTLTDQLL